MQTNKLDLSIILPTFNEEKNMQVWLVEVFNELDKVLFLDFEIIVVDDSSTDRTREVLIEISKSKNNLKYIFRNMPRSLPMSIFDGINESSNENILWLDADGSMDTDSIILIIEKFINENKNSVVVGSRFVEGGGYKGKVNSDNPKFLQNLKGSEDSPLAIFLSLIFNKILSKILKLDVYDLTSGFIIGPKKYFSKEMFDKSVYGEYFIKVITKLKLKNVDIVEVGYFCRPRIYGESKTSTNFLRLINLSTPYLKEAFLSRLEIKRYSKDKHNL